MDVVYPSTIPGHCSLTLKPAVDQLLTETTGLSECSWIELQLWFHPIPVQDIFGHNGRGSNIILSGHTRDANCSTMFFLSLSLTLSRLCEEARVERTEHVSIKNTWTPSNSFQVGDFEMTLDSLDDPFFQNWKQWLAAKVQSQEPQDQHHAAPGRALPWLCFFCCASQFMAWRSCANASLGMLGMMGMLGQVWYHPVPWPAKVARPLGIPDFGTKSRPITWRPGIWKMSKGFKRWKHHKTAINHHKPHISHR